MKRILYLLLSLLIISCSPEDNKNPSFTAQTYTAKIGDLITLSGTNLNGLKNVRIFSNEYLVPSATIYSRSVTSLQDYFFEVQTDNEIQFYLPELYAETYTIQAGDQEVHLDVKGFIPLVDILEFQWEEVKGLKVINDKKALGLSNDHLFILENGYYEQRKISSNVYFFDVLENGDSWYATTSDFSTYEIFYNSSGSSSYTHLNTFQKRDLEYLSFDPRDILVTPEKQIFIATTEGIFMLLEDGTIKKDTEIFKGLEDYPLNERAPNDLKLTPEGMIYGIIGTDFSGSRLLLLDVNNNTFSFPAEFNTHIEGPEFFDNVGYLLHPGEKRVFKSVDSGRSWREIPVNLPVPYKITRKSEIKVLDADTALIFLCGVIDSQFPFHLPITVVYITRDGGETWQEIKRFDTPRQKEKSVYFSGFVKHSGLIYLSGYHRGQVFKYVD